MATNYIKEMSWVAFDERRKQTKTVIIPTGALEVYGPHMPVGTDCIVAEELAKRVAEKRLSVITPAVEMGESSSLVSFPGTMALTRDTYEAMVRNILDIMVGYGFTNILFINGHGGNTPILTYIAKEYQLRTGVICGTADVWPLVEKLGEDIFEFSGRMAHGHAAESNTSIMLYLRPELVDMSKAQRVEPKSKAVPEILSYPSMRDMTPIGVIGDPTVATAEKGEKIIDRCVDKIVEFMDVYFKN